MRYYSLDDDAEAAVKDGGSGEGADNISTPTLPFDSRQMYVFDDSRHVGAAGFFAKKSFAVQEDGPQRSERQQVTAVAVREHGTEKKSRII